jgi:hypothetical protein
MFVISAAPSGSTTHKILKESGKGETRLLLLPYKQNEIYSYTINTYLCYLFCKYPFGSHQIFIDANQNASEYDLLLKITTNISL